MEQLPKLQDTLAQLPAQPGVYRMWDEQGMLLYVGKAKILKNRVKSYFHGPKDPKTTVLVSRIARIDWIVTRNEYEALILENNLIKEYHPRYNINLKDGKTYPVIRITKEDFPRVYRTRRIIDDGSSYYGPFPQIGAVDKYLELIEAYFPLRKCHGPLKKRDKPCLYWHMQRCSGPCAGLVSKDSYKRQVDNIRHLLSGEDQKLEAKMQKAMEASAKQLKFEQAAKFRDSIRAIQSLRSEQQITDFDENARDYMAWDIHEELVSFVVLRMRGGKMVGTETFRTEGYTEAEDLAVQFFFQYYDGDNPPPSSIYIPWNDESGDLARYCHEAFGVQATIMDGTTKRDASILEMARENARQDIRRRIHDAGNTDALAELQKLLSLPKLPLRIEGFDIAHLHGKHTVAAMVSFWKGMPDKTHYRIFSIRTLAGGIDDYQSLREAVGRRYTKVLNDALEVPDLILIDGGKGQLSVTKEVLEALGLGDVPILALAKEREEIFVPGRDEPYTLPPGNQALRVLQHVRDEAHRFGTSRNQNLRSGDISLAGLESIPGIGEKRAKELLVKFGSIQAIGDASLADLASTARLGKALAEKVHEALRGNRGGDLAADSLGTPYGNEGPRSLSEPRGE